MFEAKLIQTNILTARRLFNFLMLLIVIFASHSIQLPPTHLSKRDHFVLPKRKWSLYIKPNYTSLSKPTAETQFH